MTNDKPDYKAYLHIKHIETGETIRSVGLRHTDSGYVEKVMGGLLRNMGEDYFVDDSELDITPPSDKSP